MPHPLLSRLRFSLQNPGLTRVPSAALLRWAVVVLTATTLFACRGKILDGTSTSDPEASAVRDAGAVQDASSSDTPANDPVPGPSLPPLPATTQAVSTLATTCTTDDNFMPDFRRLSNLAYGEAVAQFTGYRMPRTMLLSGLPPQPRDQTINNVDYGLRVGRVYTSRLIDLTEQIVASMEWEPFFQTYSAGCVENTAECRRGFIERAFTAAIGRAPTSDEVDIYIAVYDGSAALNQSFEEGSRLFTRALLASPQFVFVASDGSTTDATLQRAQRISLLLYNQPSHPDVVAAARNGQLDTRAQVETFVRAALRDQKISAGIEDFYYDWLVLDRLDYTIDLSNQGYAEYSLQTNEWMRRDTMAYLHTLVFDEDAPLLRAFLDRRAFARPETAWIYAPDPPSMPAGGGMVDLSSTSKRVGVLTQPSMLTLTLKIETKSIVDRGVFVNEHILCREIPLPAAVTPIDATRFPPDASQREKLADHEQGPCATCHVMLDAPGYALEMFGPIGEFKTEDQYGNRLRDDGTFEIDGVESSFQDVFEFSQLLARSEELASCIVRKRLSHALAKVVRPSDGLHTCELERLGAIFRDSNFDIKELTVGIATSSYFMQ